jgi:hypothetical protein
MLSIDVTNMANDIVNSTSFNALGVPADLGGRDAFIAYTPVNTASHDISVEGGADLSISVFAGTCGALTEIASADANSVPGVFDPSTYSETEEILGFGLTSGVAVYIVVDGLSWDDNGEFGAWDVTIVDPTPPPPANDLCSGSEALTLWTPVDVRASPSRHDEGFDGSLLATLGQIQRRRRLLRLHALPGWHVPIPRGSGGRGPGSWRLFTGACGSLVEVDSVVSGFFTRARTPRS